MCAPECLSGYHPGMRFLPALYFVVFSAAIFAADGPDYVSDIKPLLKTHCWSCHGPLRQEGGLRLDTAALAIRGGDSGAAVVAGNAAGSTIIQRITAAAEERMPPESDPLTNEQISLLTKWINSGAKAPAGEKAQANPRDHWAFQPVTPKQLRGGQHPVDEFLTRALSRHKLQFSDPAEPVTLIRRVFMDLHGLPPTPQQIATWTPLLAADHPERDSNYQKLIRQLLSNTRYGERWAQHWLDVVRYADTHGYEVNTPRPNAWPYRDYVIRAFNEDRPFDQFIRDQLTGDKTGQDAATGFMVAAAALLPGQIGADEASKRLARQDELDEIIVGTSATFLGLTVGCARCHDHKFDPISQKDYYAFQAFFAGVRYGDRPLRGFDSQENLRKAEKLDQEIKTLQTVLKPFELSAAAGRTLIIDDEDLDRVSLLQTKNGHGVNPAGAGRGYRDDLGDTARYGNLSRSRYTWWDNVPGQDVFTWNPSAAGTFHIWISWGVHGSGVHTRDAGYVLDLDGDLDTRDDQKEIARADQYYFVGQTEGVSERKPLWSGFASAGTHSLGPDSRIVLRGGDTKTGITADVIVLQEAAAGSPQPALPRLRDPVSPLQNVEQFAPVKARYVRFTSFHTNENDRYEPCIDELEVYSAGPESRNVAHVSEGTVPTSSGNYSNTGKHQLKHINDGRYGNSFSWISNQKGRGWVQLEFTDVQTIERIEWARDREGKFGDRLAINYRIEVSIDGKQWQAVAGSQDRVPFGMPHDRYRNLARQVPESQGVDIAASAARLTKIKSEQAELRKPQMGFCGTFQAPAKTFVLNRGDPEQPLEEIAPHVPVSLSRVTLDLQAPDLDRRLALAKWISSPTNPLTARVMVNRIWQAHFGVGLVDTPSDFGLNGSRPTHPELLDWLASEFVSHNWSVHHLHNVIMSSNAYQQSSSRLAGGANDPAVIDADNRLLWKFPSRRLEAEAIRDSILEVCGELNSQRGGPGFNFFTSRGGLSGFPPVQKFTAAEKRRMIYAHRIRMEPIPIFGAFDCPDAGLPAPRRSQSTTAIQALNLFNSDFMVDQATVFSKRVIKEHPDSLHEQIQRAFHLSLGRGPTDVELQASASTAETHGMQTVCRALLNSSEFLFLP